MPPSPSRPTVALVAVAVATLAVGVAGAIAATPAQSPTNATAPATTNATSNHVPPSVAQPPNTSSYLQVPDSRFATATYETVGVDVPGAMAIDRDRLEVELTVDAFEQRFDEVSSSANRTAAVAWALDRLDGIVERARTRQATALERYNDGETDTRLFVRSLARSDATAAAVAEAVERVRERANDPLDYSPGRRIETRIANTEPALSTLDGRVRELFVNAISGGPRTGSTVYIETGDSDVVLATIFDETYIRDSYIAGSYDPVFEADSSDANARIQELYNWGFLAKHYVSVPSIDEIGNTSVFRADVTHIQGRFTLYFDSNTGSVYREFQAKRLVDARPRQSLSATNGSLRLNLTVTHDTGPLAVRLLDNATGQPRNGTVFVNDHRLGTTGSDGRLWIVDAHGTAQVRVVTEEGSVSTFVYGAG